MITVLLTDDHPVILKGLKTLFEGEKEFSLVSSATGGWETIRSVEEHKPNLLILDLMLPDLNGLQVLKRVRQISPETRVLIFSMHADRAYVVEAFKYGALGYMMKSSTPEALVNAARKVAAGERYLNGAISNEDINIYLEQTANSRLEGNDAPPSQ